jgi:ubiquinone/menaquinone biosynthesis C-methylase UbiE
MNRPISSRLANLYDLAVQDWPGELVFYRGLAERAQAGGGGVLELACGTGRMAVRLAQEGVRVVGLDHSAAMLAIAREKSAGMANTRWVEACYGDFFQGELSEESSEMMWVATGA